MTNYRKVTGYAIDVHRDLGPGLLESAYEQCLAREFSLADVTFEIQKPVPVAYMAFNWIADTGYICLSRTE